MKCKICDFEFEGNGKYCWFCRKNIREKYDDLCRKAWKKAVEMTKSNFRKGKKEFETFLKTEKQNKIFGTNDYESIFRGLSK